MFAKIFRPAKTAMQSGKAKTQQWVLEFEPQAAKRIEPLMGWNSSTDMTRQVRLRFDTQEEAVAYAKRHDIAFQIVEPKQPRRVAKAYADNFRHDRKEPWTH